MKNTPPPPPMSGGDSGKMANIVYILYLVAIAFGVTGIIGVVIAYTSRAGAPHWVDTHYRYQIRTFWIGLLFAVIGSLLTLILVGWLVLLAWAIWLVIRAVKGLRYVNDGRPIPNPETWMFP